MKCLDLMSVAIWGWCMFGSTCKWRRWAPMLCCANVLQSQNMSLHVSYCS